MKKSILAVAILGTFAGVASAQSSVTLQGTVDLNARYINNGNGRNVSLGSDGLNASELVFSGVEDLGGGLAASFSLNSGVNANTGTSSTESAGKFFNRRSTVSLSGGFGEVRLGRDYTPTFWTNTLFDVFGTVGVASTVNAQQLVSSTMFRADNAISYFLPSKIGGLYGQFMVAASEGAPGTPPSTVGNAGRYVGGRVGFASGQFDVTAAAAEQRVDSNGAKHKTYNVGGSYDFGVAKVLGYFNRDTLDAAVTPLLGTNQRDSRGGVSVSVPMGQGEIHAGYSRSKFSSSTVSSNTVSQFGLGYVYSLSKRTAVYSTVSRLSNGNGLPVGAPTYSVGGYAATMPTAGSSSTGFEFGVRHFF